jgi:hypothetical protein
MFEVKRMAQPCGSFVAKVKGEGLGHRGRCRRLGRRAGGVVMGHHHDALPVHVEDPPRADVPLAPVPVVLADAEELDQSLPARARVEALRDAHLEVQAAPTVQGDRSGSGDVEGGLSPRSAAARSSTVGPAIVGVRSVQGCFGIMVVRLGVGATTKIPPGSVPRSRYLPSCMRVSSATSTS